MSVRTRTILLWSCLLLGGARAFGEGPPDEQKGKVTYVEGTAKKRATAADWADAAVNAPVGSGDRVRTLIESRAELTLRELDVLRLAPKTTIDIVKLYEESKTKAKETQMNVESGDIWAKVASVGKDAKFDVGTPVAGAAITGTIFRINVAEDSSTAQLKVYKGEVRLSNVPDRMESIPPLVISKGQIVQPEEAPGPREVPGPKEVAGPKEVSLEEWVVIVKSFQQITIGKEGQIVAQGDFSPKDRDEQSDWVKWNLARDKQQR